MSQPNINLGILFLVLSLVATVFVPLCGTPALVASVIFLGWQLYTKSKQDS